MYYLHVNGGLYTENVFKISDHDYQKVSKRVKPVRPVHVVSVFLLLCLNTFSF